MLTRVMTKQAKRFGKVYPSTETEYLVEFGRDVKGGYDSITVFREKNGTVTTGTKFQVGNTAEYDSYNLSYTGLITKITDKAVTIVSYPGSSMARKHRLDINEFAWRNFDFDEVATAKRNHEEMMYL